MIRPYPSTPLLVIPLDRADEGPLSGRQSNHANADSWPGPAGGNEPPVLPFGACNTSRIHAMPVVSAIDRLRRSTAVDATPRESEVTQNLLLQDIVLAENGLQLILRQRLHNPIVRTDHRLGGD
jgi:hypothetical protein